MLDLDSPKWSELKHAYGAATDIPNLLRQLEALPSSEDNKEPWCSIWSSLAHQGDVYSASFAAVPYVIFYLSKSPLSADISFFQFPAWVEICRQKNSVSIPKELETDYFSSLSELPKIVAEASGRKWDAIFLSTALSAIAAAQGFGTVAEAVLEINPDVAKDFMEWFPGR